MLGHFAGDFIYLNYDICYLSQHTPKNGAKLFTCGYRCCHHYVSLRHMSLRCYANCYRRYTSYLHYMSCYYASYCYMKSCHCYMSCCYANCYTKSYRCYMNCSTNH